MGFRCEYCIWQNHLRKSSSLCMKLPFSGISTFAHLDHVRCLTSPNELFDIGIIGAPFDTAVGYRPGEKHQYSTVNLRTNTKPPIQVLDLALVLFAQVPLDRALSGVSITVLE